MTRLVDCNQYDDAMSITGELAMWYANAQEELQDGYGLRYCKNTNIH